MRSFVIFIEVQRNIDESWVIKVGLYVWKSGAAQQTRLMCKMFKVHVPLYWPNVHDDVQEEEFVTVKTLK